MKLYRGSFLSRYSSAEADAEVRCGPWTRGRPRTPQQRPAPSQPSGIIGSASFRGIETYISTAVNVEKYIFQGEDRQ